MNTSLSFHFPKSLRLLKQRQYQRLNQEASRRVGRFLLIDIRKRIPPHLKMGISVSRKYGKAHKRNRFKRIVREAFRLCQHQLPLGIEFVVKPRSAAEMAKTSDIIQELLRLIDKGL